MSLPTLHSIRRRLSERLRCRPCRRKAALLLTLAAPALVAAVAGCREQGLTDPDSTPSAIAMEEPATSPAAGPVAQPVTAAATRLPKSFFVDPRTGNDADPGTKLKPFKTFAKAVGVALAKDTVRLAPGVYSKAINGEQFTTSTKEIPVRAGVIILGTFQEEFTSQLHGGPGEIGLLLKGGATVRNLILSGFDTGIRASQGVQSLTQVFLDQNGAGLLIDGTAQATLTKGTVTVIAPAQTFANGMEVFDQAQLIMDGGVITGGGSNCAVNVAGMVLENSGRVTLRNGAKIENIAGNALFLNENSKATLKGLTTITRDFSAHPDCEPKASVVTFNSASLTLQNARIFGGYGVQEVGIESNSTAPLTISGSQLTDHAGAAVRVLLNTKVVISGSTFARNDKGVDAATLATLTMSITGSTLRENTAGIRAPFFTLRNSKFLDNGYGVIVNGSADLGTLSQPGNNTFRGSTVTGVTFSESTTILGAGTIVAAGNTWNASIQGSDPTGHYPKHPVVRGTDSDAEGSNFFMLKGKQSLSIQL